MREEHPLKNTTMVQYNFTNDSTCSGMPTPAGGRGAELREVRNIVQFRSNAPQLEDNVSTIECSISNHVYNASMSKIVGHVALKTEYCDLTFSDKVHMIRTMNGVFHSYWSLSIIEMQAQYFWSLLEAFRNEMAKELDYRSMSFSILLALYKVKRLDVMRKQANKINDILINQKEKEKHKRIDERMSFKRKLKDLKNNSFGELDEELVPQGLFDVGIDKATNNNFSRLIGVLEDIQSSGVSVNVSSPQFNSIFAVLNKMLDRVGWVILYGLALIGWYFNAISSFTLIALSSMLLLLKCDDIVPIFSKCLDLDLSTISDWLSSRESSRESSLFDESEQDWFAPLVPQALDESLLVTILSGVLAAVSFTTFGDYIKTSVISDFVSSYNVFKKKKSDMGSIASDFVSYISQFLKWVKDKFGFVPFELVSCEKEVQEWGENVSRAYEVLVKGKTTDINAEYAEYIFSLFTIGNFLMRDCPKDKPRQLESIKLWMSRLDQIIKHVKSCGWSDSYMRDTPCLIMSTGTTGVGKTLMGTFFLQELLCRTLPEERRSNYRKNPMSELFSRNVDTEFWDGYMAQWCTFYDEVGITKPSLEVKCNDITDLMKMVGTQEFILHMAHLAAKGNTRFVSKLIYATTNMYRFDNVDEMPISYPEAFARRIAVPIFVTIKKEYSINPDAPLWERKPDKSHPIYSNGFTTETYEIYLYDFYNTSHTGRGKEERIDLNSKMDYNGLLDYTTRVFKEMQRKSNLLRADLARIVSSYDVVPQALADYPTAWMNGLVSHLGSVDHMVNRYDVEFSEEDEATSEGREILDVVNYSLDWRRALPYFSSTGFQMAGFRNLLPWRVEILKHGPIYELNVINELVHRYDLSRNRASAVYELMCQQISDIVHIMYIVRNQPETIAQYVSKTTIVLSDEQKKEMSEHFVDGWINLFKSISTSVYVIPIVIVALLKLFPSKPLEEQSKGHHEPKIKEVKAGPRKLVPTTGKFGRLEPQVNADPCISDMQIKLFEKVCQSNTYLVKPIGGQCMGYMTFLVDRFAAMPVHFKHTMESALSKDPSLKFVIESPDGSRCYPLEGASWTHYDDINCKKYEDCLFVYLPCANLHTDIVKYMPYLDDGILKHKMSCCFVKPNGKSVTNISINGLYNKNYVYTDYIASDYIQYHMGAVKGDCGSLIWQNSSALPKLLGYHVAGNGNINIARVFDRTLCELYISECRAALELVPQADCPCGIEPNADGDYQRLVGNANPKYASKGTPVSKLKKTKVFNLIEPNFVYPAKLRPYNTGEGVYDPTVECFRGYGPGPVDVNENLVLSIEEFLTHRVWVDADLGAQPWDPRIWSIEEACAGIPGVDFCNSIPRSTSAGYKWSTYGRGKEPFFGKDGDFRFDTPQYEELKSSVFAMIEKAKTGERLCVVYQQFKKDETRPDPKYLRARMISASPLDFTVLVRMYFGDAMRALMKNRIVSHSAIGMNVYSIELDMLANRLARFGNRVCDFDYKFWDQKTLVQFTELACNVLSSYYVGSSDEDTMVRNAIVYEMHHSIQAQGDLLFEVCGSTPSGNPMTAPCNTLANIGLVLYGIVVSMVDPTNLDHMSITRYQAVSSLNKLSNDFEMIALGDDNVWSVSDNIMIQPSQVADVLGKLGYTVTGADKQAVGGFKPLTDCTFLKRGFRYDKEFKRFVGPLSLKTINSFPYWTLKSSTVQDEIANMDLAIRELSLHDKEIYDLYYPKFRDAMFEAYGCRPTWSDQYSNKATILDSIMYY